MERRKYKYRVHGANTLQVFLIELMWVFSILGDQRPLWENVLLGLEIAWVPVFFLFMRERVEKLWQFLLGNVAAVGYCFILGRNTLEQVVLVTFGCICVWTVWVERNLDRKKRNTENYSCALLVLMFPCLVYGKIVDKEWIFQLSVWIGVIFLWVYFLNLYMAKQNIYIDQNEVNAQRQSTPIKRLRQNGNRVMALFSAGSLGVLFCGTQISTGSLLDRMLDKIKQFLIWVFQFLKAEKEPYVEEGTEALVEENTSGLDAYGTIELNPFWEAFVALLGKCLLILIKVLMVVLALAFLVLVAYGIWKYFYTDPVVEGEEREQIFHEVTKKEKRKREHRERRKRTVSFFERDPGKKVRKHFKGLVKKYNQEQNIETKTARELVQTMEERKKEQLQQSEYLYQKARYSNDAVTKEEWEQYRERYR